MGGVDQLTELGIGQEKYFFEIRKIVPSRDVDENRLDQLLYREAESQVSLG